MIPARELACYVSLAAALALLWSCGTPNGYSRRIIWNVDDGDSVGAFGGLKQPDFDAQKLPDFGRYRLLRTLDEDEFPLDSSNRRVIFVGDIHGMFKPLNQLLEKIEYNPNNDLLIHAGDFLAKGLHRDSMATLNYMTTHNITGVRGNHDQQILEWRGWINWICSSREGCEWLRRTEHHWKANHKKSKHQSSRSDTELDEDLDSFLEEQKKKAPSRDRRWWKLIPADWKFLGGQYRIARDMSKEQYEYLLQLPLVLYIPHAHTFVAHAGILPSDPRYPYYDAKRQPLARVPDIFHLAEEDPLCHGDAFMCTNYLRRAQEMAILTDVPQNKIPWTLMNLRGVKNGKVSRKYKGVYWAKLWNDQMGRCVGFAEGLELPPDTDEDDEEAEKKKPKNVALPCYPATVVYGHAASRGLSPKRWTEQRGGKGRVDVDEGEGVEYNEELQDEYDDDPDDEDGDEAGDDREDDSSEDIGRRTKIRRRTRRKSKKGDGDIVPFGDHYKAKIVAVKCHQP
ncbi:hypothetical protein NMY22_g16899 [Coprinellus aureogranulatus]|nr:hypothetical protein NMY22_g16899 [Coprinellus aureogranulatus]